MSRLCDPRSRAGLLASVAAIAIAGCGGGCHSAAEPRTETPAPIVAEPAPPPIAELSPSTEPAVEIPLLPQLTDEALAARLAAQRALLGGHGLFEDASGRPVPWIASGAVAGELDTLHFEDDLLDSLPGSSGLGAPGPVEEAVDGNALGLYQPIEPDDASTHPLSRFYLALHELQAGRDDDGKVRVLVYGASHTDADVYPQYLRAYLRERFGDGGHGFVHIARPWKWYRHAEVAIEGAEKWITEHAQRKNGRPDGLFGLIGVSLATKSKKAFGRIVPDMGVVAAKYEVFYLAQPKGGSFDLFADGKRIAKVKTRADTPRAGYHAFALPEGQHTVEVRPLGDGEVRLFGASLEREGPGVVVDTLGIGGTRAANLLTWDETVWGDNVRHRAPDLVILAYGTNESNDTDQSIEVYESDLHAVLDKLQRVAPQADCLLAGPGDFPLRGSDGSLLPRPRVNEIIAVQRRVAGEHGCGFWDSRAFMGGELAMDRWVRAQPPMAKRDYVHLTKRGYVRMGMALVDAMMVGFDR